jgi:hypothetical protein
MVILTELMEALFTAPCKNMCNDKLFSFAFAFFLKDWIKSHLIKVAKTRELTCKHIVNCNTKMKQRCEPLSFMLIFDCEDCEARTEISQLLLNRMSNQVNFLGFLVLFFRDMSIFLAFVQNEPFTIWLFWNETNQLFVQHNRFVFSQIVDNWFLILI